MKVYIQKTIGYWIAYIIIAIVIDQAITHDLQITLTVLSIIFIVVTLKLLREI